MQDRVPLYPGRVKLNPVSGQENTYDMVRSDDPTQEGDPLSKATFLKDATAALYGLGTDAVPDDVLNVLSRLQNGLGNEYVWAKTTQDVSKGQETSITLGTTTVNNSIEYSASVLVYPSSSAIQLANPSSISSQSLTAGSTQLSGMYFRFPNGYGSYVSTTIYYVSATSTVQRADTLYYINAQPCTGLVTLAGYVNSPDHNAYPIDDGYTYTALGQIGNKVRIATGSYTGTGTYGKSNPNSLTFDFPVKVLFITAYSQKPYDIAEVGSYTGGSDEYTTGSLVETWPTTFNSGVGFGQSSYKYGRKSADGKTFEWYTFGGGDYAYYQANESGKIYRYIAIG